MRMGSRAYGVTLVQVRVFKMRITGEIPYHENVFRPTANLYPNVTKWKVRT